jgi:hypothetical protein
MTAAVVRRGLRRGPFPEAGIDQADQSIDGGTLVRAFRTKADPMVGGHTCRQQHEDRLPVDRALLPGEVLDGDLRREPRGRLCEQRRRAGVEAAWIPNHDLDGTHNSQPIAAMREGDVEGQVLE